jgi:hypothetical protein
MSFRDTDAAKAFARALNDRIERLRPSGAELMDKPDVSSKQSGAALPRSPENRRPDTSSRVEVSNREHHHERF